jgi:serine/threonine protein phosphatase PrpC
LTRKHYKCYYAKSYDQLPLDEIAELSSEIVSYYSGPDYGVYDISLVSSRKQDQLKQQQAQNDSSNKNSNTSKTENSNQIKFDRDCYDSFEKCDILEWNLRHHRSYGIACSLYENNLVTNTTVGDPVADSFAILTRQNSSIMLLGDGVNWGPRSRLASRCAVRASMNYLNKNLFMTSTSSSKSLNTHEIFKHICRSFDAAQDLILQKKGTMTTLCCCVVVKLKDSSSSTWVVCTLSIGDSTAYVFNKDKGIFELTYGSRNLNDDRDMRNVGGALGHVYGNKPDATNLNYSLMYIKENDIVFLVSDGISDNLDPIVSQTARRKENNEAEIADILSASTAQQLKKPSSKLNRSSSLKNKIRNENFTSSQENDNKKMLEFQDDQTIHLSSLPQMTPYERYLCSLAHMNEILKRNQTPNDSISAQETCAVLIEHVLRLTANKREVLEKGLVEAASLTNDEEKIKYQARLREKVQKLRGKLDHASIVAYEVGTFCKAKLDK